MCNELLSVVKHLYLAKNKINKRNREGAVSKYFQKYCFVKKYGLNSVVFAPKKIEFPATNFWNLANSIIFCEI